MERERTSEPRKRVHLNEDIQTQNRQYNPNQRKWPYILDQKLAEKMQREEIIYKHQIGDQTIYFPHKKLYKPQRKFLQTMFDCLTNSENLLIESPTGTGKTLNLLVSSLAWADSHYLKTEGQNKYDNQTKIIYTSRAHSQLDQISKELQRTPYRPKMLLFGSRQKLCINEQVLQQFAGEQNAYDNWTKKCSEAVRIQQRYLQNKEAFDKQFQTNKKTVENLKSKSYLSSQQKEELKSAQQFLNDIKLRCTHYHDYNEGVDADLWKSINRQVLNSERLKDIARNFEPHSTCPYNYSKRVKNRGTLYLMPYNYILDQKIVKYSAGFLSNSVIIFDQGHNAPATACEGYSVTLKQSEIESTIRNIKQQKLLQSDEFNAQQLQTQNFIRSLQQEPSNIEKDNTETDPQIKQIRQKNRQKLFQGPQGFKYHHDQLIPILKNIQNNFQNFFKFQRTEDDFKQSNQNSNSYNRNHSNEQRRSYFWQEIKLAFSYQRQKIISWIEDIFFSQQSSEFDYKPLKQKLQFIIKSANFITNYFVQKGKRFFKLMNFLTFCQRLYSVLYDKEYFYKFFIEIKQFRKYDQRLKYNIYQGQIQIRCLAPSFAFKQLQKLNPRSIIITSGTLNPMNVFAQQIGLRKLKKAEVDSVITEKNILVRKITKDLNGDPLKIDAPFYCGRYGLQTQNLTNLFNLLIKTVQNIPHGVIVIVSSNSCLKNLQKFYNDPDSAQIRDKLRHSKPHVYFEPRKNLKQTMKRYEDNSVIDKGALLFCVCRGKLSQGIDFKDKLCRSVIFLGIPYAPRGDSFIVSKGNYLRKMKYSFASTWKFIQASKAINQGLGRAVRHQKDYGSILLFDDRYQNTNKDSAPVVRNISKWIQNNWKPSKDPNQLQKELSQFYSNCETLFPPKNKNHENKQQTEPTIFRSSYAQNL